MMQLSFIISYNINYKLQTIKENLISSHIDDLSAFSLKISEASNLHIFI